MPRSLSANRVRTAQILLLVVVILGALYVMDAVVGSGLIRRPYDGDREPRRAAAASTRASVVSYRGNRIGKVTDLDVTADGVRAVASIQKGTSIPVDTEAVVSNLSAVGEQRLDFRPRVDHGPCLKAGSVVAEKDTGLPLATSTFFLHTKTLTDQIDVDDVRTISRELGVAFGDPDLDLRRLYDQGDQTLGDAREAAARDHLADRARPGPAADRVGQQRPVPPVQQGRAGAHRVAAPGQPRPRLADPQRQGPRARSCAATLGGERDDAGRPARQGPRGQRDRRRPTTGSDDVAGLRPPPGEVDDRRHPRRLRPRRTRAEPVEAVQVRHQAAPPQRHLASAPRPATATAPRSTR